MFGLYTCQKAMWVISGCITVAANAVKSAKARPEAGKYGEAAMKTAMKRAWLVAGIGLVFLTGVVMVSRERRPQNQAALNALWAGYKAQDWDAATGRSFDKQNGGVTTSEGQSYTMLRAVWGNDQSVFDKTWQWTRSNLRRPDGLLSWRWGSQAGGQNAASDADSDAALALLMAGARWHRVDYLAAGRNMLGPIWNEEVIMVQRRPVLAADNLEKSSGSATVLVNPSYFSPAAYRVFARFDKSHDWPGLAASSYDVLNRAGSEPLDVGQSSGLPPDWVAMDRHSGALTASAGKSTDFGYDALRSVWRTALDRQWNHAEAQQALGDWGFLGRQWGRHKQLAAVYGHDGDVMAGYASVAMYGGTLGYFQFEQPDQSRAVAKAQLLPLYDPGAGKLTRDLSYYDNNWAWFGLALFSGALPNLAGGGGTS
jgi:endo-1,4-beta-D-glucanase Y